MGNPNPRWSPSSLLVPATVFPKHARSPVSFNRDGVTGQAYRVTGWIVVRFGGTLLTPGIVHYSSGRRKLLWLLCVNRPYLPTWLSPDVPIIVLSVWNSWWDIWYSMVTSQKPQQVFGFGTSCHALTACPDETDTPTQLLCVLGGWFSFSLTPTPLFPNFWEDWISSGFFLKRQEDTHASRLGTPVNPLPACCPPQLPNPDPH